MHAAIFVIDHHAAVREALGEMLSVFGYAVKTYESADGFLQELDQRNVGVDGCRRPHPFGGIAQWTACCSGRTDAGLNCDAAHLAVCASGGLTTRRRVWGGVQACEA